MSIVIQSQSRLWRKCFIILATVTALLFSLTVPALAITYGEPDLDAHPFVGAIVLNVPGHGLFVGCTGTLISENVFLTAAHCKAGMDNDLANNPDIEVLGVTFDATISEDGTYYYGEWFTHPNFTDFQGAGGRSDPHDVAVIVLDQSPGITPAQLPHAGLLDELQANHTLKGTSFTAVGYGTVRQSNRTGFQGIIGNLDRNRVEQGFHALTFAWLILPMTFSTGDGGTCYGDSGGPHFIHLGGVETNIVASITVTGDAPCKASDVTYRMDTESARSFLSNFVALP